MVLCRDILSTSPGKWIFPEFFFNSIFFPFSNRSNPPTQILILKVIGVPIPTRLLFRTIMDEDLGKICTSSGIKKIDILLFGILTLTL
jgi:hypothetical protein